MIREKYFTFQSAEGLTDISAKYWIKEGGEPKAVLQIVHGMVEYKERYHAFACYMAERDFVVVAHDHLGHGDSVISEEKWGYMTPEQPARVLIEDMQTLRQIAETDYPGLPYFMLGHSMGSFMLRMYLAKYGKGLAGAIIMGTGNNPRAAGLFGVTLCDLLAKVRGWDYRSSFVQSMTYDSSYKKYDVTGKKPQDSWLTKDQDIVRKYYQDPKCTYVFTLTGYKALFEAVAFDASSKNAAKLPKNLPLLLVSGAEDPVGQLGKGVKEAAEIYKKAGCWDVSVRLYPGDRHEILNELDRLQVYADLERWMGRYL